MQINLLKYKNPRGYNSIKTCNLAGMFPYLAIITFAGFDRDFGNVEFIVSVKTGERDIR